MKGKMTLVKLDKEIERVAKLMIEAEEYATAVRKLGEEIDMAVARKSIASGYNHR